MTLSSNRLAATASPDSRTKRSRLLVAACATAAILMPGGSLAATPASRLDAPRLEMSAEPSEAATQGPVVHAINARPDEDRGFVSLARYVDHSASVTGNTTIITTRYEPVCKVPCGVPIDISERPIFFFVRDGSPISGGFRIPGGADELTLNVRPARKGMLLGGWTMIATIALLPIGIPLAVIGRAKVSIAEGSPGPNQDFVRLKKART